MNFRLTAATGLHKGDREYQQDQLLLVKHPRVPSCILGVVADGMGGRSGGRNASVPVVLTARQLFERYTPEKEDTRAMLHQLGEEAHLTIKLTAVSSEQEPHSTLTAFIINPAGDCHWVHCGDSRIYHFRAGELVHRTIDHSYVQTLVDSGEITAEQAQSHPESNVLMSCLGMEIEPQLVVHSTPVLTAGDVIMACSDGVWHYFSQQELAQALTDMEPREASEYLIEKACRRGRGGGDNLSIVIVKFSALDG